jgi:Tfp pilus assembly protein PilZ
MQYKRKNERFGCFVPVDGKEGSFLGEVTAHDVSKGGMGIISKNKIPLDTEIAIELDLSEDEDPVFVVGKVEWIHPMEGSSHYRVGMSFKDVLKGSKSRLNKYFIKAEKDKKQERENK